MVSVCAEVSRIEAVVPLTLVVGVRPERFCSSTTAVQEPEAPLTVTSVDARAVTGLPRFTIAVPEILVRASVTLALQINQL